MNCAHTPFLFRMFSLDGLVHKVAIEMPVFNGTHQEKVTDGQDARRPNEKQKLVKRAEAKYVLNEQDRKS